MRLLSTGPKSAAFTGFLFTLPFIITNFVVALRLEPFYSFLGSFPLIRTSVFIPLGLLLLFPIGAFITLYPMLKVGTDGKRNFYITNILLALIIISVFAIIFIGLGEEMYRCEILKIPNCD